MTDQLKLGDVYKVGRHIAYCGDVRNEALLSSVFRDEAPSLAILDPPYGLGKAIAGDRGRRKKTIYKQVADGLQNVAKTLARPSSLYLFGAHNTFLDLYSECIAGGRMADDLRTRSLITWHKRRDPPGRSSQYMPVFPPACEHILYATLGCRYGLNFNTCDFPKEAEGILAYLQQEAQAVGLSARAYRALTGKHTFGKHFTKSQFWLIPKGDYELLRAHYPNHFLRDWATLADEWKRRDRTRPRAYLDLTREGGEAVCDLWDVPMARAKEAVRRGGHPTTKPIELFARMIRLSLPEGGLVWDPYAGSGTTLWAADQEGARAVVGDIDPHWLAVTLERYERETGHRPIKIHEGGSDERTEEERRPHQGANQEERGI